MNKILTKDAGNMTTKRTAILKFAPASEVELKALGEDLPDGYVAGWASTPDLDLYRHVVKTGAFDESIAERGLSGPKSIKLLLNHNWQQVAGVIKVLETRNGRLWIEAQLNLDISYAKDMYEAAKMAGGLNFSVGFSLQDYEFKEDDNEREYLLIKRGDLFEVSIVPFPGNEEATMEFIKGKEGPDAELLTLDSVAAFEKMLVATGVAKSRNEANRITKIVKHNASLFVPSETLEVEDEPAQPKVAPLSADKMKKLSEKMAEMRALLSK